MTVDEAFEQHWEEHGVRMEPKALELAWREVAERAFRAGYCEGYEECLLDHGHETESL